MSTIILEEFQKLSTAGQVQPSKICGI